MTRQLVVNGTVIDDTKPCYVIAEIGHNHQGNLEQAKALFVKAHEAGVNAVKLQKRNNRALYTREMYNKSYDHENSFGASYGEHREFLEFGREEYEELKRYAAELKITFFATAFDFQSADFLMELDMPAFKIASGDLKNTPLLVHVARFGRPMFVSTGGGSMDDVRRAYDAIMPINPQLCLLQCTASYPCAIEQLNLRVVETFRNAFPDIVIGLSSHDNGIAMALVGYMLGAKVVEKHFTLDRAMKGTDHVFSLTPDGMRRMVRDLHRVDLALGDGRKHVYENEKTPIMKMGKKLVAARALPVGHRIMKEDIAIKSPGDGLPPYELANIIGKVTNKNLEPDENIQMEFLRP